MTGILAGQQAVAIEVLGEGTISVPGRLEGVVEGQLRVSVSHWIGPKSRVRVLLPDDRAIEGHIAFQNQAEAGYTIGVDLAGETLDARKHARCLDEGTAMVSVLEQGISTKIPAMVLDSSRDGLGLTLMDRVHHGAWVKVELADALVFGEIRYCTALDNGTYRVGLVTDTVVRKVRGKTASAQNSSPQ